MIIFQNQPNGTWQESGRQLPTETNLLYLFQKSREPA